MAARRASREVAPTDIANEEGDEFRAVVAGCGMIRIVKTFVALGLMLSAGCAGTAPTTRPCTQEAMTPPVSNVAEAGADPTVTDPDKYKEVMVNEHVRVLRYHDAPGAKTHQHHHPASVLYALSAFRRRLAFPDGTTKERDFKPGDVMWVPAQTHVGENIGTTDTEVLLVEMKGP
jgi:quercetin dioxygenase-like cupin family protein